MCRDRVQRNERGGGRWREVKAGHGRKRGGSLAFGSDASDRERASRDASGRAEGVERVEKKETKEKNRKRIERMIDARRTKNDGFGSGRSLGGGGERGERRGKKRRGANRDRSRIRPRHGMPPMPPPKRKQGENAVRTFKKGREGQDTVRWGCMRPSWPLGEATGGQAGSEVRARFRDDDGKSAAASSVVRMECGQNAG